MNNEDREERAAESLPEVEIEQYWESQYDKTKNPLYVWKALAALDTQTRLRDEHFGVPHTDLRPIPVWCIQYLMQVAQRISTLTLFLDERIQPQDPHEVWKWIANPSLTPAEAAARLSEALGIDWTSFTKLRTDDKQTEVFLDLAGLRADGLSSKEAMRQVMEKHGIADERTVRRYVAAVRGRGETTQ